MKTKISKTQEYHLALISFKKRLQLAIRPEQTIRNYRRITRALQESQKLNLHSWQWQPEQNGKRKRNEKTSRRIWKT